MEQHAGTKESREYAWKYFELHARQRMAVFNYFVLIAALLTAGLAGSLGKDGGSHVVNLALGLSLILASFVFWKLDQRVRFLIKHAEAALRTLEKRWASSDPNIDADVALFCAEETTTADLQSRLREKYGHQPWRWHMTYYECFRLVYILFAVVGILGVVVAIAGLADC